MKQFIKQSLNNRSSIVTFYQSEESLWIQIQYNVIMLLFFVLDYNTLPMNSLYFSIREETLVLTRSPYLFMAIVNGLMPMKNL